MLARIPLAVLAALAAVRVAVPLAALAASGSSLPGLPRYDYVATTGDGSGFYAATREFLASWGRLGALVVPLAAATLACVGLLLWAWRRRRLGRAWLIVLGATAFSLVVSAAITQMRQSGAAVFGWPLLWSLPMLPYRALGGPLDQDIAAGFGLTLSLAANVVTVIAVAYVGLYATGRRNVGLAAASLFAFWPLLAGLVGGEQAWENGTWSVDAGLAMYTEPVSTALVATGMALLLSPRASDLRLALAGVAFGLATAVKLTNGLLAAAVLVLLLWRLGARRTAPYLAGALSLAPVIGAFVPKGHAALFDSPNEWAREPFSTDYVFRSWTDSLLFTPRTLLILVPLAVLGALALRSQWPRAALVSWALVNPIFYSFYRFTPEHPRFLFASLPAVLVLWSLGASVLLAVVLAATRRLMPRAAGVGDGREERSASGGRP